MSEVPGAGPNVILVWLALLIGAIVYVPIFLPPFGFFIQVAAFDFVVIALIIWGLWRGWLDLPPRRVLLTTVGMIAAITVHSALFLNFSSNMNVEWSVKESAKLIVVVVLFGCLLILFRNRELRTPPKGVVALVLVGAIPVIALVSHFEPIHVTRTVYAVTLASLVLLLGQDGKWRRSPKEQLLLTLACLAVAITAVLLHNKAVAAMVLTMAVWIAFGSRLSGITNARVTVILGAFAFVFLGGLVLIVLAGAHIDLLRNMDTLERSVLIRFTLWSLAIENILATFPAGTGLGQFPEAARTVPLLALEGHKFVHNSFLGLVVDLGLLGAFIAAGLAAIVLIAAASWPVLIAPMFLVVVLPPLLIHDGHTIRMLLIVTALGLARHIFRSEEVLWSRRW